MLQPPPLPSAPPTILVGSLPPPPSVVPCFIPPPPPVVATDEASPDVPTMDFVPAADNTPEDWHEFSSMAISTAVHSALFLILALLVPFHDDPPPAVQIVSSFEEADLDFEESEMLPVEMPQEQLEDLDQPVPEVPADVAEVDAADIDTTGSFDPSDLAAFSGPLFDSAAGANAMLADFGTVRAGGGPGGGGGFGGELGRRLTRAGARTGAIQISLSWNNFNDLDLHVVPPSGERIYFNRRRSKCGGHLDVDMNAGGAASKEPVENVYWARQVAPAGAFQVFVDLFAQHDQYDETPFELHVLVDGVKTSYKGVVRNGSRSVMVAEFQRTRGGAAGSSDDEFPE